MNSGSWIIAFGIDLSVNFLFLCDKKSIGCGMTRFLEEVRRRTWLLLDHPWPASFVAVLGVEGK